MTPPNAHRTKYGAANCKHDDTNRPLDYPSSSAGARGVANGVKNNRQRRDDSNNIIFGHASNSGRSSRMETNSSTEQSPGEAAPDSYRPKFFNYEPSNIKYNSVSSPDRPFDESPVKESKIVVAAASSSPRNEVQALSNEALSPRPKFFDYETNIKAATSPTVTAQNHSKQSQPIRIASRQKALSRKNECQQDPPTSHQATTPTTPKFFPFDSPTQKLSDEAILQSASFSSGKATSQLQSLMLSPEELICRSKKKPTKNHVALNVMCNDDGFEVQDVTSKSLERDFIYRVQSNVKWGLEDVGLSNKESVSMEESSVYEGELGRNGWHRLLREWETSIGDKGIDTRNNQSSFSPQATATLDQLSAIHILQHSLAACDEYDALRAERSCLLQELRALEKDRLCLENMFLELEKQVDGTDSFTCSNVSNWRYRDFKENIDRVESEDKKKLPLMWLEELTIMEDVVLDDCDRKKKGKWKKKRRRHKHGRVSKDVAEKLRDERGPGLALLISDANAKNSIIGRCYMNSIGKGKNSRALSVEGPAILIPNGGGGVRFFAITGSRSPSLNDSDDGACSPSTKDSGTSYFIKFDAGKSNHRGMLPINLAARLQREERDPRSLRYLTTGPSSSSDDGKGGSVSPYYAEFDDGECWWGMASGGKSEDDEALHQIFIEMDVHRVSFGSDSSWIVIGKDGDVVWKNIPQGLHNVLISRDALSTEISGNATGLVPAAPCEASLGMGGSYFIRFLDGIIEYSLPSFVADVCDRIEAKGEVIRNVALSADTYECLIRYSKKNVV
ncbi:hypothetical protein HJC23_011862 [Cyclotella cryptica]|uniref:Uncharacterized protein n=1 Tax=Cyclotella cryptica TaxID=29204 RepID=A0ABD3QDW4_9STRA|eukprot:CCRYP_006165-RA/>CCRYP_006165-RA protein AED:0.37 eAED:0.37 QI:0/-1/0/1/-1/1/1/0/788